MTNKKLNQNQTIQKKSQLPGASQRFVLNQGSKAQRPNTQVEESESDGSDVNLPDRSIDPGRPR